MMQPSHRRAPLSRRQFLALTGTALTVPTLIPATALGRADRPAPSARITLGVVGCGSMGNGNTKSFLGLKECQVVAACDVDRKHLAGIVNSINHHYNDEGCKSYHDYRELMARSDIDAVMLALPDHWHALAAVEAAQRKKDIYGEKPLAGPSPSSKPLFGPCRPTSAFGRPALGNGRLPRFIRRRRLCAMA